MYFCSYRTDKYEKGLLLEMCNNAGFGFGNGAFLLLSPATQLFLNVADNYLSATFFLNETIACNV